MFGRSSLPRLDKVDTIVGKETEFKGTLKSHGVLRIDGRVDGEVLHTGDVFVGEKGLVAANIRARHVTVAGEIRGNIEAEGRIELVSTARLHGDIKMAQLVVADGAVFQGSSSMKSEEDKVKVRPQPPADSPAPANLR